MGSKKVLSIKSLASICFDLKKQGKRIALTHGAFDLFHYSHLDLLKQSARISDFMIVGIDCDRNVREYKGGQRPIVNEIQRLAIITELQCVDAAFIYDLPLDSKYYSNVYKELGIDIVTIGYNFKYEDIMDEQTRRGGAQLVKLKTDQNLTTTSLIDSIVGRYLTASERKVPKE